MEVDELKLAWKELNEKVNANDLVNKKTLTYILETQRKTALQKMMDADRGACLFLTLMAVLMTYLLFSGMLNHLHLLMRVLTVTLITATCVVNCILYKKLTKIDLNGSPFLLYKQIASYKQLTVWVYIMAYVLVAALLIVWFIVDMPKHIVIVWICILIPVCFIIDYFLFHRLWGQIHTLIETTRELKELKGEQE